jgi:hypothetical protein
LLASSDVNNAKRLREEEGEEEGDDDADCLSV